MDVSIIICTRNGAERLPDTLGSLDSVRVPSDLDVELILVNNGSTDRTGDVMAAYSHPMISVRHVDEVRPGKTNALKTGVSVAKGAALLFTDDDVRFPDHWIESMARPILQGDADAVAGGVTLAPTVDRPWMTSRHRTLVGDTGDVNLGGGNQLFGANMSVSRRAFEQIVGYHDRLGPGGGGYGAAEDTFVALQLQRADLTIMARPDVTVEHHPDDRVLLRSEFRKKAEARGRAEAFLSYHWYHRSWPTYRLIFGWVLFKAREWRARYASDENRTGPEGISMREYDAIRRRARIEEHLRLKGERREFDEAGQLVDEPTSA